MLLRHQRADHTGQHIAQPAGRHRRMTMIGQCEVTRRVGNQAAAAFQNTHGTEFFSQRPCRSRTIGLDRVWCQCPADARLRQDAG